jgi:hypothetical protein
MFTLFLVRLELLSQGRINYGGLTMFASTAMAKLLQPTVRQQSTNLRKAEWLQQTKICTCGYTVQITAQWTEKMGPRRGLHHEALLFVSPRSAPEVDATLGVA